MGEPWLVSLPKKGIVSGGMQLSELTTSAHPTDASGGGASGWPTPQMRDWKGGSGTTAMKNGRYVRVSDTTGTQYGAGLDGAAGTWPTPTTAEAAKIANRPNYGQVGLSNHPAIVGYPEREKMKKSREGDGRSTQPGHLAHMMPTDGSWFSESDQTLPPHLRRRLNSSFVEWMMGVPIGWTSLKPLAMDSFHAWWQSFSGD